MPAGRPKKPTHLKIVQGNPGKRALPDNEPKPKKAIPPKPKNLNKEAAQLWDIAAVELSNMGVLTLADGPALRMLCEAWDDYFKASDILKHFGSMTYETQGVAGMIVRLHPAVGIKERADARIRAWMGQFGMTPASRSRIEKAADDEETDDIESLFTGGAG